MGLDPFQLLIVRVIDKRWVLVSPQVCFKALSRVVYWAPGERQSRGLPGMLRDLYPDAFGSFDWRRLARFTLCSSLRTLSGGESRTLDRASELLLCIFTTPPACVSA